MKLLEHMAFVGKRRHLSPLTIACYQSWVKDFLRFHRDGDRWRRVRFFTVGGLVTALLEAREERQLERMLKHLQRQDLVVLDELGYP